LRIPPKQLGASPCSSPPRFTFAKLSVANRYGSIPLLGISKLLESFAARVNASRFRHRSKLRIAFAAQCSSIPHVTIAMQFVSLPLPNYASACLTLA
jgi:hypothetical protein